MTGPIAFQGRPGAYSELACRLAFPDTPTLPCLSFEAAIEAVRDGRASRAMLACENSLVGRVPDIHRLLPDAGLSIVGERFARIEHCLMGIPGTSIGAITKVHSHEVALGQVRGLLARLGAAAVVEADTAGAAELVAGWGDPSRAAIASRLAAELNGLEILASNVEDAAHNTTRFYVCAGAPDRLEADGPTPMTTLVFRVRNVPASLYKALGGFATNGVNMTRLESYMVGGAFTATRFLCDVEGHPDHAPLARALDELRFHAAELTLLGTYARDPFRDRELASAAE